MPSYSTKLSLPDVPIVRSEAEFIISHDKKQIGRLRISVGSIDWFKGRARSGKTLTWREFSKLMEETSARTVKK